MTVEQYVEKMIEGMISKPGSKTKPVDKRTEDRSDDKQNEVGTNKENSEAIKDEEETSAESTFCCYQD